MFYTNFQRYFNVMAITNLIVNPTQIHIVAVEYPGYGIYKGHPTAE